MNATTTAAINNLRTVVLGILRAIRHDNTAEATVDTVSLGEDNPILNYPGLGVWVGYGPEFSVKVRTLAGMRSIPAYAVGVYRTINNYPHAPDEVEDVELSRTSSLQRAAEAVGGLVIHDICENVMGQMSADNLYEGE